MKILQSGAKYSEIVAIGEQLKQKSLQTGEKYLMCHRGINSVCNINLNEVVKNIDFNSTDLQTYPNNSGRLDLKQTINKFYFNNLSNPDNISITNGSISGIDITFQIVDTKEVVIPRYHWGPYVEIVKLRKHKYSFYENIDQLQQNLSSFEDKVVVICDPSNPLGNKLIDEKVYQTVELLNNSGAIVLFDCPYRRIFLDESDTMYQRLLKLENVIILESFSKSLGLSGQRIGFIHSTNSEFNNEVNNRVLYQTAGTNAFAQLLVNQLLTTEDGKKAVQNFKHTTVEGMKKNIEYLRKRGFIAEEFYKDSEPVGIFTIINRPQEELLRNRIGSVSLSFFVHDNPDADKYARICVSMPHEELKSFFDKMN